jgi:hypothetical protein
MGGFRRFLVFRNYRRRRPLYDFHVADKARYQVSGGARQRQNLEANLDLGLDIPGLSADFNRFEHFLVYQYRFLQGRLRRRIGKRHSDGLDNLFRALFYPALNNSVMA